MLSDLRHFFLFSPLLVPQPCLVAEFRSEIVSDKPQRAATLASCQGIRALLAQPHTQKSLSFEPPFCSGQCVSHPLQPTYSRLFSSVSKADTQLWTAELCQRGKSRRSRRMAPPPSKSSKVSKTLSFFPIKDSYGTTQLVVQRNPQEDDPLRALSDVPVESAVLIQGHVRLRPNGARRAESTGDIEVQVDGFKLLNPADREIPFVPSENQTLVNEDLRARYRYLDLRRSALSHNIRKRGQVAHLIRNALHDQDFIEVETPMLLKSSPEGAREFLVPTRVGQSASSGDTPTEPLFYALPQSPQQPKQLLICSGGIDRYYQIAKCFRDEDGRKDRQPEFTQVDLEMAFVSWGSGDTPKDNWRIGGVEVREVIESIMGKIWGTVEGTELPYAFPVMTYKEAMTRYGSDKPDTRYDLEITDLVSLLSPERRASIAKDVGETLEAFSINHANTAFTRASASCQYRDEAAVVCSHSMRTEILNS